MCEEVRTCDSRARVGFDRRDSRIWAGIHQLGLCGISYRSDTLQVQGESHMLADGGSGCNSRDGLAV